MTVTQDLSSVTVGYYFLTGNSVFTISTGLNGLILNQVGSGSGVAVIENAATAKVVRDWRLLLD